MWEEIGWGMDGLGSERLLWRVSRSFFANSGLLDLFLRNINLVIHVSNVSELNSVSLLVVKWSVIS